MIDWTTAAATDGAIHRVEAARAVAAALAAHQGDQDADPFAPDVVAGCAAAVDLLLRDVVAALEPRK